MEKWKDSQKDYNKSNKFYHLLENCYDIVFPFKKHKYFPV